jgi:hypothetical protein
MENGYPMAYTDSTMVIWLMDGTRCCNGAIVVSNSNPADLAAVAVADFGVMGTGHD